MRLRSRSGQGWRRRLPSGTSAAMSARERLEARRRIEHLLDEDRWRVAPPPEKATTPVGWLDHERRRCSLEGVATTSSFESVDDERRRTAGRRKPILDRKRKKQQQQSRLPGTISGAPSWMPPTLSSSLPTVGQKDREGERGIAEGGELARCIPSSSYAAGWRPPNRPAAASSRARQRWKRR